MKNKIKHWDILLKQYLKRDFIKIIIWVVGLGFFIGGFVPAFVEIGKGQGLAAMFETMKNPAMIAMIGPTPVDNALDYTVGAMYSNEMLLFCGVMVMIVASLHMTSHTRKEEESGLSEFICSYPVGRYANSFALIIEMMIVHVMLSLFIGLLMAAFRVEGMGLIPSLLFGASIGIAGLMGAMIALVMSQIMPTSTGATGTSLALIGFLYLVRGGTDLVNVDLSMINPVGWIYLTYPFTNNNWLPIMLGILFSIALVCISFKLEGNRDLGEGYISEKENKGIVKKSLLSVQGLFIRLNRTIVISWLCMFMVMGVAYGSIYGEMQGFLEANDLVKAMFTMSGVSMEESFTAVIMVVMAGLVCFLPIVIVNKLYHEESSGHLSQYYATHVTRKQTYYTTIILAIFSGALGMVLACGSLGFCASLTMNNDTLSMMDFLMIGFNYFPAVLFVIGLGGFILGWVPQYGKALYAYMGLSLLLTYFRGVVEFPWFIEKISILSWFPKMTVEPFDSIVFIGVTIVSIVLIDIGYMGYCRRDLRE